MLGAAQLALLSDADDLAARTEIMAPVFQNLSCDCTVKAFGVCEIGFVFIIILSLNLCIYYQNCIFIRVYLFYLMNFRGGRANSWFNTC